MDLKLDLEINDIWYEPFWKTEYNWYSVTIILILIICSVSYYLFSRKKNIVKIITIEDLINELKNLSKRIDAVSNEQYYTVLILVIKQFCFIKFKIDCSSKTEQELMLFIESQSIQTSLIDEIKELIINAQKTKFYKSHVSRMQMEINLDRSIELLMTLNKNFDTTSNYKTT